MADKSLENKEIIEAWDQYIRKKSIDAKNFLIVSYLPLVKASAARLSVSLPGHININDLISAGICGLISAIERFDPSSGTKFKSFSNLRIYGAMLDELRSLDWVPRSVRAKSRQVQAAYNAVQQQKGRYASDVEVAEFLGISLTEFDALINKTKVSTIVSLDAKIYNPSYDNQGVFSDFVEDTKSHSAVENITKKETKQIIINAIQDLSEQEKIVLTLYYFEELTLKEIGEVLKVTESRISQIHSKAIYRLRARLNLSEVADYGSS